MPPHWHPALLCSSGLLSRVVALVPSLRDPCAPPAFLATFPRQGTLGTMQKGGQTSCPLCSPSQRACPHSSAQLSRQGGLGVELRSDSPESGPLELEPWRWTRGCEGTACSVLLAVA